MDKKLAKELNFYETPKILIQYINNILSQFNINEKSKILEPSAGKGAIIGGLLNNFLNISNIDYCEINEENRKYIENKYKKITCVGEDFLQTNFDKKYNFIIANPPFSQHRDVIHVTKMIDLLDDNGLLIAIISPHSFYKKHKVDNDFVNLIKKFDYHVINLPGKLFEKTEIFTKILIINKTNNIINIEPFLLENNLENNKIKLKTYNYNFEFKNIIELNNFINLTENKLYLLKQNFQKELEKYNINNEKNNIDKFINDLCPGGVKIKPLYELVLFDRKFIGTTKLEQPKIVEFVTILRKDLEKLKLKKGNVKLLSAGLFEGYTTKEKAGKYINKGEVIAIPMGINKINMGINKSVNIKYYNGFFVNSNNILLVARDGIFLKYIYYYLLNVLEKKYLCYRGLSRLKCLDRKKFIQIPVPVPPFEIQSKIAEILDNLTNLQKSIDEETELLLYLYKKRLEYYRSKLLSFEKNIYE